MVMLLEVSFLIVIGPNDLSDIFCVFTGKLVLINRGKAGIDAFFFYF